MLNDVPAFSSFSTNDLDKAKDFYGETLDLKVEKDDTIGVLNLKLAHGGQVMIYPKDNHEPASFTVLNFVVDDIEKAVDELAEKGVEFEHYDTPGIETDDRGISDGGDQNGPKMAWFKDPGGNTLAVMQMP